MNRRDIIAFLGGAAAVAWPLAARAQQTGMPVIGFLNAASLGPYEERVSAFRRGLRETGYFEGRNVAIEFRWADGQYDRLPAMAAELVRRRVAVIVVNTPAVLVAKAATTTIPVVFYTAADPVAIGLVASLSRPGGNITGVTSLNVELVPKRVELLHELIPEAGSIAALINPDNPAAETQSNDLRAAVSSLGLSFHIVHARAEKDFDAVFASLTKMGAGALVIAGDPVFTTHSEQLGAMAVSRRVPAIYQTREFAAGGGLVSYVGGNTEDYHQVGIYTGRVLKGEKPADLPVQQTVAVELVINLKTARALNINVPVPLLARADEVIE